MKTGRIHLAISSLLSLLLVSASGTLPLLADSLVETWIIAPGDRPYVATGNTERGDDQSAAHVEAPAAETFPQLFQRPTDPLLGSVFASAQARANLGITSPGQEPEHHGVPVGRGQFGEGVVQHGLKLGRGLGFVRAGRVGRDRAHGELFPLGPPHLAANLLGRGKTGGPVQPARDHRFRRQRAGLAGEVCENQLGHIPGEFGVAGHPAGGGPDEIEVPADQLGEGFVAAVVGVAAKQFLIGVGVHRLFGR